MKSLGLCAALCLCGALALPPVAEAAGNRRCTQTMVTDKPESNAGYKSCLSFERGRLGSGRDLERLEDAFGFQWKSLGLSTDPDFGPFAADPAGQASGMLRLKELREDVFAIGLQAVIEVDAAEEFLFYIFDYSKIAGTQSIAFDTLGFDDLPGPILQAAGVFTPLVEGPPPPPPGGVPEPGSLMLTFAGLCALAVRRRRGNAWRSVAGKSSTQDTQGHPGRRSASRPTLAPAPTGCGRAPGSLLRFFGRPLQIPAH